MYRRGLVIKKGYSVLRRKINTDYQNAVKEGHTAIANNPHFIVSADKPFLLTDHSKGTTRSVAT